MKERGIIIGAGSVLAYLRNDKSETRRVIKKADEFACLTGDCPHDRQSDCDEFMQTFCPFGRIGDRLWGREAWDADFTYPIGDGVELRTYAEMPPAMRGPLACLSIFYRADGSIYNPPDKHGEEPMRSESELPADELAEIRWHSPIHMPRWMARIVLEIIDVKFARLHDMTNADAVAEGVESDEYLEREEFAQAVAPPGSVMPSPLREFERIWDSINAKRGYPWEKNDFVWVIKTKRVQPQ